MATAPNREDLVEWKIKEGYTKQQAQQLSWADWWEWERPNYSWSRRFEAGCSSCGKYHSFGSADSVRLFLEEHKGTAHKTRFFTHK